MNKLKLRPMKKKLDGKPQAERLYYEVAEAFFLPCPFDGEYVNVFQVPETRYGKENPYGWTLECKNMGCILERPSPDQSLRHLAEQWNTRK